MTSWGAAVKAVVTDKKPPASSKQGAAVSHASVRGSFLTSAPRCLSGGSVAGGGGSSSYEPSSEQVTPRGASAGR